MSRHSSAVFGIYADPETAKDAVGVLKNAGFRVADISILLQANPGTKDLGHRRSSKAPEGAVAGGGLGAMIGPVWLAGGRRLPGDAGTGALRGGRTDSGIDERHGSGRNAGSSDGRAHGRRRSRIRSETVYRKSPKRRRPDVSTL
jgi:hypothetical protein